MKKFEADTLEEVYEQASKEFTCSIVDLDIDIVQQSSSGFFGLFGKKKAIILAEPKNNKSSSSHQNNYNKKSFKKRDIKIKEIDTDMSIDTIPERKTPKKEHKKDTNLNFDTVQKDEIFDGFYDKDKTTNTKAKPLSKDNERQDRQEKEVKNFNNNKKRNESKRDNKRTVEDQQNKPKQQNSQQEKQEKQEIQEKQKPQSRQQPQPKQHKAPTNKAHDIKEIKIKINSLFSKSCFELDEIIVEDYDEDTIYIEFNGEDCALLIGKEGYRYKALSYMIFNWIHETYGYMIRLEVAEFLQNQEDSVNRYIDSIVDNIDMDGRGQTKPLDGILVHIALTRLRVEFPNKYVAVKTNSKRQKYIVINDFKNR
jgi:spoIIIJ-associated protein